MELQHQLTLDSANGMFLLEPGSALPRGGGLAVFGYPGRAFPRDKVEEGQTKIVRVVQGMERGAYVVRSLR